MNLLVAGVLLAWPPFALSIYREKRAKQVYSEVLTSYLILCSSVATMLFLFSNDLFRLVAPNYTGNEAVIGILAFSYMLNGAYSLMATGLGIEEKTIHIAWPLLLSVIVNVAGYFVLIPRMGLVGAALSSLISNGLAVCLVGFVGHKYYPVRYNLPKIAKLGFVCSICVIAHKLTESTQTFVNVTMLSCLILVSYVGALIILNIVNVRQILDLKRLLFSQR
jgi:O-antigen/teichoic acid export membrane protein